MFDCKSFSPFMLMQTCWNKLFFLSTYGVQLVLILAAAVDSCHSHCFGYACRESLPNHRRVLMTGESHSELPADDRFRSHDPRIWTSWHQDWNTEEPVQCTVMPLEKGRDTSKFSVQVLSVTSWIVKPPHFSPHCLYKDEDECRFRSQMRYKRLLHIQHGS